MKHQMLTHRQTEGELSACGLPIPSEYLTDIMANVTCRSCNRDAARNYRSKSRSTPGYGDPDFKGTGANRCFHCGRPILEHPLARVCPFPPVQGLLP